MLLSLQPLINFSDVNHYNIAPLFQLNASDTPILTFRLVDLAVQTDTQGFYPPGRPYIPNAGIIDRLFVSGLSSADTVQLSASGLFVTITLITAGTTWTVMPQSGDQLNILTGSVLAGTGNANIGSYMVISATSSTLVAVNTNNRATPVNVGPLTFSATPANDLQDTSLTSVLTCVLSNIDNSQTITRFANQPFPSLDASIWQLTIFPSDYIVGTYDIGLTLNENSKSTINGIAKAVVSAGPSTQINASMVRVLPTRVLPIF